MTDWLLPIWNIQIITNLSCENYQSGRRCIPNCRCLFIIRMPSRGTLQTDSRFLLPPNSINCLFSFLSTLFFVISIPDVLSLVIELSFFTIEVLRIERLSNGLFISIGALLTPFLKPSIKLFIFGLVSFFRWLTGLYSKVKAAGSSSASVLMLVFIELSRLNSLSLVFYCWRAYIWQSFKCNSFLKLS